MMKSIVYFVLYLVMILFLTVEFENLQTLHLHLGPTVFQSIP